MWVMASYWKFSRKWQTRLPEEAAVMFADLGWDL